MTAIADPVAALIAHLLAETDITTLTSTRIASELVASWSMPTYALVVDGPKGSPGDDEAVGLQRTRFDLRCYGSTGVNARTLWRTVHSVLCPRQDIARHFTASNCRVFDVVKEGGPTRLIDPDTRWPLVLATYIVKWGEVATA